MTKQVSGLFQTWMETRKLDTYQTTVNVIVTFEEEEPLECDLDVTVKFNLYPLNRELDCVEQIMSELVMRDAITKTPNRIRDYSRLVKLSITWNIQRGVAGRRTTASHQTGPRWEFIGRVGSQYYFQPNQRDLIEDVLVQKFDIASNTAEI